LKAPAEALEDRVGRALGCLVKLQADQMGIRSSLSSRYGIEFDAVKSVVKVNRKLEMRRLVEKEIAQSLVGESAGGWFDSWTFESQKEFVSLKILNVSDRSDVLQDYVVSVHVKRGQIFTDERKMKLRLTYGSQYTRIKLVKVKKES
jgi:hypothetical protein